MRTQRRLCPKVMLLATCARSLAAQRAENAVSSSSSVALQRQLCTAADMRHCHAGLPSSTDAPAPVVLHGSQLDQMGATFGDDFEEIFGEAPAIALAGQLDHEMPTQVHC